MIGGVITSLRRFLATTTIDSELFWPSEQLRRCRRAGDPRTIVGMTSRTRRDGF
jgi:hypothetical protein